MENSYDNGKRMIAIKKYIPLSLKVWVKRILGLQPRYKPCYERLEGTQYSRYLLPIEYMPSRDYRPRWGYSKPPIQQLDTWFRSNEGKYRNFIAAMRPNARALSYVPFKDNETSVSGWLNVPYVAFDSIALYTMVQAYKPKRFVEIGSGATTLFAKQAIVDAKLPTHLTSIDPEPRQEIDKICDTVIRDGLETCDLSIFDTLEANDILFFDGSHRSFMNSDVTVFFIDVLPRLKPGVIVHIHDIHLPWDYHPIFRNWYWNEQYLLAVYMMGHKDRIDPLLPTTFICKDKLFDGEFKVPMFDLGEQNIQWRAGGAMWFTHTR